MRSLLNMIILIIAGVLLFFLMQMTLVYLKDKKSQVDGTKADYPIQYIVCICLLYVLSVRTDRKMIFNAKRSCIWTAHDNYETKKIFRAHKLVKSLKVKRT